jgi:hypothetical protein
MFKIGDRVFDDNYGKGVVTDIQGNWLSVSFNNGVQQYTLDGRWSRDCSITLFKTKEMKNYYYVGQKVSHQAFGDGVVRSINLGSVCPIIVDFGDFAMSFTTDGCLNIGEYPTLSQKPHVHLELEEIVSFEKGELVWVRCGIVWDARYYSHFDGVNHFYFSSQQKNGNTFTTKEVKKFADNPLIP